MDYSESDDTARFIRDPSDRKEGLKKIAPEGAGFLWKFLAYISLGILGSCVNPCSLEHFFRSSKSDPTLSVKLLTFRAIGDMAGRVRQIPHLPLIGCGSAPVDSYIFSLRTVNSSSIPLILLSRGCFDIHSWNCSSWVNGTQRFICLRCIIS